MAGQQPPTINEEAGLGPNWVPVDGPPIIPGQMVAAPPASDFSPTNPKYIQGTIAPNFQHDASFVDTGDKTAHVPKFDLMPLGPQQSSISSAQLSSVIKSVVEVAAPSTPTVDDDTIKLNAQAGTQYTVQLSDLNKLISMSNNAGGTVYLPPVAGTTNVAVTNTIDSPFNSGNTVVNMSVATSTATFTATKPVAVGDFMFLAVRNVSSHLDVPTTSMSDSNNGAWSAFSLPLDDPAVGADTLSVFWVRNTVAIAAGGSVTLTFVASFPSTAFNPDVNEFWTMTGIKSVSVAASNSGTASGATFSSGGATASAPTTFVAVADSNNGDLLGQAPVNSQQRAWTQIGGGNPGSARFYILENISGGPVNDVWTPTASGKGFIDILMALLQALAGDIAKLTTDFLCYLENTGTGSFNLVSSAPIDGSTTTSVVVGKNQGLLLLWDATTQAWYTERGMSGGTGLTIQQDGTNKPVEPNLNFLNPLTATDTPGTQSTNIEIKELVNAQTGVTYTILTGDKGHLVTFSNTGAVAVTLPQAGSAGFAAGWFADVENLNTGVVTITPTTSTINGLTTLVLYMNQGARIISDGTNYFVIQGVALAALAEPVNAQTGTSYTVADADRGKLVTFSNVAAVAITLPQAATASKFASGWFADFENLNTGVVTITPTTSTINGAATYVLQKGQGVRIVSDGTNYQVLQGSPTKDIANGYAGLDANIHLSVAEMQTAVDARTTTSEAISDSDRGKLVTFSNSSAVAATIAQAGASSLFTAGWYCYIQNTNSGIVTLTPTTSTINGDTTLVLQKNQGGVLVSNGTNYFFVGALLGDQNSTLTDGFLLSYDGTNHKWIAIAPGSVSGISAVELRGINIAVAAGSPGNYDVLRYSSANNDWEAVLEDGMEHGDNIWSADAGFFDLYEEFDVCHNAAVFTSTAFQSPIGRLGWGFFGSTGGAGTPSIRGGNPPHYGILEWGSNTTSNGYAGVMLNALVNTASTVWFHPKGMDLLNKAGWKAVWVFKFGGDYNSNSNNQVSFAKKSMYIGFTGTAVLSTKPGASNGWTSNSARPDHFLGLRYDTSTTPAAWGVNTVANASAGTTVYTPNTGSGFTGGTDTYKNCTVVVSGCANAANNGTFTCTTSNTTTLTLNNASGVSESPNSANAGAGASIRITNINITAVTANSPSAGKCTMTYVNHQATTSPGANGGYIGQTFTGSGFTNGGNNVTGTCVGSTATTIILNFAGVTETPTANTAFLAPGNGGPNDSTFKLEVVDNPQYTTGVRHNAPGTVFDTSISPQVDNWYRLEISCTATGQVAMTLYDENNNTNATHTFTVSMLALALPSTSWQTNASSIALALPQADAPSANSNVPVNQILPLGAGSSVTISGFTAPLNVLNGTWTLADFADGGSVGSHRIFFKANNANLSASQASTFTFYPSLTPIAVWGDDDTGATSGGTAYTGPTTILVDLFRMGWNKGIASPSTVPNVAKSRYW